MEHRTLSQPFKLFLIGLNNMLNISKAGARRSSLYAETYCVTDRVIDLCKSFSINFG